MWETPLSENLQKEIVSAYERLCRPILTNPIELLGYKISFMGEAHLRIHGRFVFLPHRQ